MNKPRIIGPSAHPEWRLSDYKCTCCGRQLDPAKTAWLEMDQRTNVYHDLGGVPEDKSQGWFPFGIACAKRMNGRDLRCETAK